MRGDRRVGAGPFVPQLTEWGIEHVPLRHATRSVSTRTRPRCSARAPAAFPTSSSRHRAHPQSKPGLYGRLAARAAGVPGIVNTVHGFYAAPEDPWSRRAIVYALERAASTCSQVELFQNPEDLEVMNRLRVPGQVGLLGNGVTWAASDPNRSDQEPPGAERSRSNGPSWTVNGGPTWSGRKEDGCCRGGGPHAHVSGPRWCSWRSAPRTRARDELSTHRTSPPPALWATSSSAGTATMSRTSMPASTSTCFRPTGGIPALGHGGGGQRRLPVIATDIRRRAARW